VIEILSALTPIFALILFGFFLKRRKIVEDHFWPAVEKITYYLFFPCMLATTLSRASLKEFSVWPMLAGMLSAIFVITIVLLVTKILLERWKKVNGPLFTSLYQGAVRFNTYVGLAAAAALYGEDGIALMAVGVAVCIPTLNILCVVILSYYGHRPDDDHAPSLGMIFRQLIRNPLILGCAIGIGAQMSGLGLPGVLGQGIEILGRAALPLGLLAVGAGLEFSVLKRSGLTVYVSSALRLLIMPVLTLCFCLFYGAEPLSISVALLFQSLPTATSAFILAKQLGGDHEVMAAIITLQTLLAAITMPALLIASQML